MSDALLVVDQLEKRYSGVVALSGVSLEVREGEILAILGPNGSGKTTLFNVISGFTPPTAGTITFRGHPIQGKKPKDLVAVGLTRSFQESMAFATFTLRENLEIAPPIRSRESRMSVDDLLDLCGLREFEHVRARSLPYGIQRKLGVAIALSTAPEIVLLDEPGAGLSAEDSISLAALIRTLPEHGVAVACIDHNLPFLLPIADRVVVLDAGTKIFEGGPDEVKQSPVVIAAYLGSYHE